MKSRRNSLALTALLLFVQVAVTEAWLCTLPLIGWIFQLLLPFLCDDVVPDPIGPPTGIPTGSPVAEPPTAPTGDGLPQGPAGIFEGFEYAGCFMKKTSLGAFVCTCTKYETVSRHRSDSQFDEFSHNRIYFTLASRT